MAEDWLGRWREARIGWHEPDGNASLKALWPSALRGSHVLVPLCGKARDLHWLALQGACVTGVELSPIAAQQFFAENELRFTRARDAGLPSYRARELPITFCIGDYFSFRGGGFDALYDRGALVAMPPEQRPRYAAHTDTLLAGGASRLVITLEYDQAVAGGPPYSVPAAELLSYWPMLERRREHNDIANCPPKFRAAGLTTVLEVAWCCGTSRSRSGGSLEQTSRR